MEYSEIRTRAITALRKSVQLQRELYTTYRDLTDQGSPESGEFFARAAYNVGLGLGEIEDLCRTLGVPMPWDDNYKQHG